MSNDAPASPAAPPRRTSLYDWHVRARGAHGPVRRLGDAVQYQGIVPRAPGGAHGRRPLRRLAHGRARAPRPVRRPGRRTTSSPNDARGSPTARRSTRARATRRGHHPRRSHRLPLLRRPLPHRLQRIEPRQDVRRLREGRRAPLRLRGPERPDRAPRAAGPPGLRHPRRSRGSDAAALATLGSFHFRDAVVANVHCTVARTGYTGEDGVEIFCAPGRRPCPLDAAHRRWGRPSVSRPSGSARATRSASKRACRSTATTSTRRRTRSRPASAGW